jgi:type 1 glutamine amidotransferase
MKIKKFYLFTILIPLFLCAMMPSYAQREKQKTKKVILLAGAKSHPPGEHEYIKTVRLLKAMLDNSNVASISTEIYYNGWPDDPGVLNGADLILSISDGQDGELYSPTPFLTPDRMLVMEKLMKKGCGFITIHFSTFAPDHYGEQMLEWGGGYFDWQDNSGERNWYSAIKTIEADITAASLGKHPITNGVKPFRIKEEFYYNIRFLENDKRLTPIVTVPQLESRNKNGNVVAWAITRKDGGRGFGTTMGHYYSNWEIADFRKLILNAIVWTAGAVVPAEGVIANYFTDAEVNRLLYNKTRKVLILTGDNHPAHLWKETTPVIQQAIEKNTSIKADVSTNIEDLSQYTLPDYDLIVLNYCNWNDPRGLSDASKKAFTSYLNEGGGLMIIHFANGAFHSSLPESGTSDWPEYRRIVRRVWDHHAGSAHDKFGKFLVDITDEKHPITEGMKSFHITDELYYNQRGDDPIIPLLTARSKDTGKEEPLAWVYTYGKGKIFQTLLGHDAEALQTPEVQQILMRAAQWICGDLK